jgi:hypothetical protein
MAEPVSLLLIAGRPSPGQARYQITLVDLMLCSGTVECLTPAKNAGVQRPPLQPPDFTSGLLSPELAAGIHRVKGVRKLGSRLGNWLTAGEASARHSGSFPTVELFYFFSVPLRGVCISLACYVASIALLRT